MKPAGLRIRRAPARRRRSRVEVREAGVAYAFLAPVLVGFLVFVLGPDLLGIAVHAIGIYGLISGWRATRSLRQLEAPAPALVG